MITIRTHSNLKRTRIQARGLRRTIRLAGQELAQERARDAALARLVTLLENNNADGTGHLTGKYRSGNSDSRLARLRAAHAAYALDTSKGMKRAGQGAFFRVD